jgi:hypothetical protein
MDGRGMMTDDNVMEAGGLTWMRNDLAVTHLRDGRPLLRADSDEAWRQAFVDRVPAYREAGRPGCGLLYNVHALDAVIPEGWRMASESSWLSLAAAVAQDGALLAAFGFKARVGLAYFGPSDYREDSELAGYWNGHGTPDESWGTDIRELGVKHFSTYTRWGEVCDYGLFVRCVRKH